jgi:hypothetical protein
MIIENTENSIKNIPIKELNKYYDFIKNRAENSDPVYVKYLTLGNVVIKIKNYFPGIIPFIETQFACCLSDEEQSCDKTFYLWKDDVKSYTDRVVQKARKLYFVPENLDYPLISICLHDNELWAHDPETETWYFSLNDFSTDIIRRMGHLFVKQLSEICRTPQQVLIHSAAVGIDDYGVLISSRGNGGKSTLAVSALLDGFRYVSDDYLIMNKSNDGLFAYPVYSTINIMPEIREKLQDLKAEYLWNSWWQPQKQTLSIHDHHARFARKLPIRAVVFPQISDVVTPSIEPMKKGKAIAQMVHSTISQLGSSFNTELIRQMTSFVQELDFYQINLCKNLNKNVNVLRKFITHNL